MSGEASVEGTWNRRRAFTAAWHVITRIHPSGGGGEHMNISFSWSHSVSLKAIHCIIFGNVLPLPRLG